MDNLAWTNDNLRRKRVGKLALGRAGGDAEYNDDKFDKAGESGSEGGVDHWRCRRGWWW
jgi:hypothetical protein